MLSGTQKLKYQLSVIRFFAILLKSIIMQIINKSSIMLIICYFIRKRCITLHKTISAKPFIKVISAAINPHTISILNSNFIERHTIISKIWLLLYIFSFEVNLPSTQRILSHSNVYKSCYCIDILILSLCPNVMLTYGL